MDQEPLEPRRGFSLFIKLLIWLAGADGELLARCPPRDLDSIRTIAFLMIGVWGWQTIIFAVVAHMMLALPGAIRPELVGAAMLLATLVLLLDSFCVMRTAWHLHGLQDLTRGGLDLTGGPSVRVKNWVFLSLRLGISFVLATLVAVFMSLLMFDKDIASDIDKGYQAQNSTLFIRAADRVDEETRRAASAITGSNDRIAAAVNEISVLRRVNVDPVVNSPELQPALEIVARLEGAKADADRDLASAQAFATNELAGIRGSPGNTGVPGVGPVRKAAEEHVDSARHRAEAAAEDLAQARARLQSVQQANAAAAQQKRQQAEKRLVEVSKDLQAEQVRHDSLEAEARRLSDNREALIRAAVESDPTRVPAPSGFLARIEALQRLAENREILALIILFDLAFLGIELAAVFAKVTSFVPTTYATLLAKESYLEAFRTAQFIAQEINSGLGPELPIADGGGEPPEDQGPDPADLPQVGPDRPRPPSGAPEGASVPSDPLPAPDASNVLFQANGAPKRRRGRPPKAPAAPPLPLPPPVSSDPRGQ